MPGRGLAELPGDLHMARRTQFDRCVSDRLDLQWMMGRMAVPAFGHFRIIAMGHMTFLANRFGLVRIMAKNTRMLGVFAFELGDLPALFGMTCDTALLGGERKCYRGNRHMGLGVALQTFGVFQLEMRRPAMAT